MNKIIKKFKDKNLQILFFIIYKKISKTKIKIIKKMNMYTQSLYNKKIYNSERNFKPKLNSYNIKTQIQFNPIDSNKLYSNAYGSSDEYRKINDFSDIAFLETKLNIKMMAFKIKKFKSFLNNTNNFDRNLKFSRNIKKKIQISKSDNDPYFQLRKKLTIKCRNDDDLSDIADDIVDAFDLDNNDDSRIESQILENEVLVSQDVFKVGNDKSFNDCNNFDYNNNLGILNEKKEIISNDINI